MSKDTSGNFDLITSWSNSLSTYITLIIKSLFLYLSLIYCNDFAIFYLLLLLSLWANVWLIPSDLTNRKGILFTNIMSMNSTTFLCSGFRSNGNSLTVSLFASCFLLTDFPFNIGVSFPKISSALSMSSTVTFAFFRRLFLMYDLYFYVLGHPIRWCTFLALIARSICLLE